MKASYYHSLKNYAEEIAAYDKYMDIRKKIHPDLKDDDLVYLAYNQGGEANLKLGQLEAAIINFEKAIKANKENGYSSLIPLAIAKSLVSSPKLDEASLLLQKYVQAVNENPNNFMSGANHAYIQLGRICQLQGDLIRAKDFYEKVLNRQENPRIEVLLADPTKIQALIALASIEAQNDSRNKNSAIDCLKEAFSKMNSQDSRGKLKRVLREKRFENLKSILGDLSSPLARGSQELAELAMKILVSHYVDSKAD